MEMAVSISGPGAEGDIGQGSSPQLRQTQKNHTTAGRLRTALPTSGGKLCVEERSGPCTSMSTKLVLTG